MRIASSHESSRWGASPYRCAASSHPFPYTYHNLFPTPLHPYLRTPHPTPHRHGQVKPVSAEEIRDCKQPLSPKELMMVTGGPKTIDFGTVSVYTQVTQHTHVSK